MDKKPDLQILKFKKKVVKESPIAATVFLRKGLIGLEIKDGLIFMNSQMALQLTLIILSAIQAKNSIQPKGKK